MLLPVLYVRVARLSPSLAHPQIQLPFTTQGALSSPLTAALVSFNSVMRQAKLHARTWEALARNIDDPCVL